MTTARVTTRRRCGAPRRRDRPLTHARRGEPRPRRHAERAAVGGVEVLPFSVLIFVFATLMLVNAWGVIDAKLAVTSAAREATRTLAESDGASAGDAAARRAAEDAISAYGRDARKLELQGPTGDLVRCGTVSYRAAYPVPAIRIPVIGGFGRAFDVTATHSSRVDALRSGVPGEATCGG